jgi:hypothetical protein
MKGIVVDAKTQKQTVVDDGLPPPPFTPSPPLHSIDLDQVAKALKEIDTMKIDIATLKAASPGGK